MIHEIPRHKSTFDVRCVHFIGGCADTCAKGVKYADVKKQHDPPLQYRYQHERGTPYMRTTSLPCFKDKAFGAVCDLAEFPTTDQIMKHHADSDAFVGRMLTTRKAIIEDIKSNTPKSTEADNRPRSAVGKIQCPICGSGEVRYSQSGYNGHIHAACSTENCVSWME